MRLIVEQDFERVEEYVKDVYKRSLDSTTMSTEGKPVGDLKIERAAVTGGGLL